MSEQRRGPETLQLGINYRGSSLAREENDSSANIHAGDRAPDAPCSNPREHLPVCLMLFGGLTSHSWPSARATQPPLQPMNQRYGSVVHAHSVARTDAPTGNASLSDSLFDTEASCPSSL